MSVDIDKPHILAAAQLSMATYLDEDGTSKQKQDISNALAAIPPEQNGPYKLLWGPATNNGILTFVGVGADGSYGVAFRGSLSSDSDAWAFLNNWFDDLMALSFSTWSYPHSANAKVTWGMNDALSLAIASTDPDNGTTLIDYLRAQLNSAPGPVIVAGHSLGAALANIAAVWLVDQLPRVGGPHGIPVTPFTFAAPTVTDSAFATLFEKVCPQAYHCVNLSDVVPMAWNNCWGIYDSMADPGPKLSGYSWLVWKAVGAAAVYTSTLDFAVLPGKLDTFTGGDNLQPTDNYATDVGLMHSMQGQYYAHVASL